MLQKVITLATALMLAVPGSVWAQGHHGRDDQGKASSGMMGGTMGMGQMSGGMCGSGSGMMGMGSGMMGMGSHMVAMPGGMGLRPSVILKQKDALKLTESQVSKLEAIQDKLAQGRKARMERVRSLQTRAAEALKGEKADVSAYESALKELSQEWVKLQVEGVRLGQQALEALTPEQRSNVRYGMHLMRGMMGAGMTKSGQGMEGASCPMMGSSEGARRSN